MFLTPWNAVHKKSAKQRGRGRIARACDACFSRKIRCDVAKPRCDWCKHHDQPCTFQRMLESVQISSAASATSNLSSVQDRTENSTPSGESPTSSSSAATDGNPRSFSHNLRSAGRHLGNICTFNGTPVLSKSGREWLKSCTGQDFHLDRFPADVKGWQLSQPRDPSDTVELPPLDGFLAGVEHYQSSAFGIMFPLIDTPLLRHTIDAAYYNVFSDDSFGSASARACILAFHAHILTVLPTHEMASPRPAIDYFQEAYALLPEVIHETATLDGLQAMLALSLCAQGLAGDIYTIDYLLSVASRFAIHLRGNLAPEAVWEEPSATHYHTRHIFWILYLCDKGFSLVSGLAPRLEESQCDLEFSSPSTPQDITEISSAPHIFGDPLPGSYLRCYVLLSFVQSRIYRELYSPAALKQTDAELLERIRDLDCALEDWRVSLPISNRPSLVTPQTKRPTPSEPKDLDMRTSVFHIQYHHSMIMIHQASSRCTSWTQNQNTHGTGSSLAISVAASRCLLGGFLYSPFELSSQNLLFTLSYFIQASIIILCQSLSQSVDATQQAQDDIILLGEISDLIRSCVNFSDPACYSAKIQFASEVIGELKRLAQCRPLGRNTGRVVASHV